MQTAKESSSLGRWEHLLHVLGLFFNDFSLHRLTYMDFDVKKKKQEFVKNVFGFLMKIIVGVWPF